MSVIFNTGSQVVCRYRTVFVLTWGATLFAMSALVFHTPEVVASIMRYPSNIFVFVAESFLSFLGTVCPFCVSMIIWTGIARVPMLCHLA